MKSNYPDIQSDANSLTVSARARLLMSQNRQKLHNRANSMLQRAASEVGIDE